MDERGYIRLSDLGLAVEIPVGKVQFRSSCSTSISRSQSFYRMRAAKLAQTGTWRRSWSRTESESTRFRWIGGPLAAWSSKCYSAMFAAFFLLVYLLSYAALDAVCAGAFEDWGGPAVLSHPAPRAHLQPQVSHGRRSKVRFDFIRDFVLT